MSSRLRVESETMIRIAYRIDQGRYTDDEIAFMHNVHPSLVQEIKTMVKFIVGRKYQKQRVA